MPTLSLNYSAVKFLFFLEEQEESSAAGYQPMMDLTRFQRLIQELDKDNGAFNQETARNMPAEQAIRKKSSKAGEWEQHQLLELFKHVH